MTKFNWTKYHIAYATKDELIKHQSSGVIPNRYALAAIARQDKIMRTEEYNYRQHLLNKPFATRRFCQ